jgi:hypothetical protein
LQVKLPVMQAISPIGCKGKILADIFDPRALTEISKKSGFSKRTPRKISAFSILLSYMNFINSSSFSFHNWSVHLSMLTGQLVSKQAIHKRINDSFVQFAEDVLSFVLRKQFTRYVNKDLKLFRSFGNVYLQDATHFSLPLHMASVFPGNNAHGATRAVAKIVTVFNLKKGCFSLFKLTSFLTPDASSTGLIYDQLRSGDLIIRDLGYFAIRGFSDLMAKGACFLSRYKYNVMIYDYKDKTPVNLAHLLKKHKQIDMMVFLSALNPIPVRIVARPLTRSAANTRRRKARADKRNNRIKHNKDYYYLLGYSIYITNVDQSVWTAKDIANAYKCRWGIEILFKSWKSNLNAHYTSPDRYASEVTVKTHFYLLLIYVSAFIMPTLLLMQNRILQTKAHHYISIMKLTQFMNTNFFDFINIKPSLNQIDSMIYYTKYDKRNDRINAEKFLQQGN